MSDTTMIGFRPAPHQLGLFSNVKKGKKSEKLREIVDTYLALNYCPETRIQRLEEQIAQLSAVLVEVNAKLDHMTELVKNSTVSDRIGITEVNLPSTNTKPEEDDALGIASYFSLDSTNSDMRDPINSSEEQRKVEELEAASYFSQSLIDL